MYVEGDYDLAGFAVGAAERGALLPRGVAPGDTVLGPGQFRRPFQRLFPGAPRRGSRAGSAGLRRPHSTPARIARPGADDADADLCAAAAGAAPGGSAQGGGAHHRRRPARQPAARAARRIRWPCWSAYWPCRRCSAGWPRTGGIAPSRDAAGVQLRHRHGAGRRRPGCRSRAAARPGGDRCPHRPDRGGGRSAPRSGSICPPAGRGDAPPHSDPDQRARLQHGRADRRLPRIPIIRRRSCWSCRTGPMRLAWRWHGRPAWPRACIDHRPFRGDRAGA